MMKDIVTSKHHIAIVRPDVGLVAREVSVSVCGNDVDTSWIQAILSRVFYIDSDGPMRVDVLEDGSYCSFNVNAEHYRFPADMVVGLDADNRGNCFSCGLTTYVQQELDSAGSSSFVVCNVGNRVDSSATEFASKFSNRLRTDTFLFLTESSFGLCTTSIVMVHIDPFSTTALNCIHADLPIELKGVVEPSFKRLGDLERFMEDKRGKHGSVLSINGSMSYWG